MKKVFFLILLVSTSCFGADSIKSSISKTDTIKFNTNDSIIVPNINKNPPFQTLILLKETKSNFLKDILPLIALILGIVINKFLDWLKDRKQISKTGGRWVAELRGLEEPIQQQIDILKTILEKDTEDVYNQPDLTVVTGLNGEIFNALDKSDLLKYIQRKNNKKNYNEVVRISNQTHGIISIISNLDSALREKFKEYQQGISLYTAIINENLPLLTQAFANYGRALEQEFPDTDLSIHPRYQPILSLFNTHILPHIHDSQFDAFSLGLNFFDPLKNLLAHLQPDENTKEMALATAKCLRGIKGLRMEKRYWREHVRTIVERYIEHISEIKKIADRIESR